MTIKSIKGTLAPKDPVAITKQTAVGKLKVKHPDRINENNLHSIWLAANNRSFFAIIEPQLWEVGVLKISSEKTVKDEKVAAKEFIDRLAGFLLEDGIPELGLHGEITLVSANDETSANTVIHRLLVKDNEVLYSQASLKWENYTVAGNPCTLDLS